MLLIALSAVALCSRPAWSQDDPVPLYKVTRTALEETVIDGLGATPLGKLPVLGYKAVDFARELGDAATDRENTLRDASLILIDADAALIRGKVANGTDLSTDPQARAAIQRLRQQLDTSETNHSNTHVANLAYIGGLTLKHLDYATATVGMDQALSFGLGRVVARIAPGINKALGLGREVQSVLGNKSALKSGLGYLGWRKFGARATKARQYTEKLVEQMTLASLEELANRVLGHLAGKALEDLYNELRTAPPVQRPRLVRLAVTRDPLRYSGLLAAAPAPIPAVPAEPARVVPLALAAPALPIAVPADPLTAAIRTEDTYVHVSQSSSSIQHSRSRSESSSSGAPSRSVIRSTAPPRVSGSWDGRAGSTLFGR